MSGSMGAHAHIGRIVNNIDPHRLGAVEVEILGSIGNQRASDQQLITVKYISPSFGSTDVEQNASKAADHHSSQQSYGFWSPPPNLGTLVLVFFVGGDPGQGYYIGSIPDASANHMVPGIAASTKTNSSYKNLNPGTGKYDQDRPTDTISDQKSPLPVVEANRPKDGAANPYLPAAKRPIYTPVVNQLKEAGYVDDPYRGPHTGSSMRESPSNVHGWSTPGPLDKNPGAPKKKGGPRDTQATVHTARLPGHYIMMDDGDETQLRKHKPGAGPAEYANVTAGETGGNVNYPKDQQIRIRAANGAQFIMHCAEDFIHINNSRGTAWVEITSNGKIDIYTADCVSVHTEADYNITADRDVNIHAGRSINMHADHDVNINSKTETHIKAETNIMMSSSSHVAVNAEGGTLTMMGNGAVNLVSAAAVRMEGTGIDIKSSGHTHMSGTGDFSVKGDQIFLGSSSDIHLAAKGTINGTSSQLHLRAYSEAIIHSDAKIDIRSSGDSVIHADGKISVDSGDAIQVNGTALNLNASGAVKIKGSTVDINGAVPDPPHRSAGQSSEAAEPNEAVAPEAHPTKTTADTITKAPAAGHGPSTSSRVPTSQPYKSHENFNPPGHTQDLTDRNNSNQPYNSGEAKRQVKSNEDLESIPPEQGGGPGKQGTNIQGNKRNPYSNYPSAKGDPSSNVVTNESKISNRGTPSDWVQDQEFMGEVAKLSGKLGIQVAELLAIFSLETGSASLDPSKSNGENCAGLVQICKITNPKTGKDPFDELSARSPKEAADDDLSPQGIRKMTRKRQMFWIDKYFDLILPNGAGGFPSKDRACYVYAALASGSSSQPPPTQDLIFPFSDARCKAHKGWQDPNKNFDCTVTKACTWLRHQQKHIIEPKLGSKSYSPDLSAGPGSTIAPAPPASAPPPASSNSNWSSSSDDSTMPKGDPGIPNAVRWSWYKDKYIAVSADGSPIDQSGNIVDPGAAYSKPPEKPPAETPPKSTGGLPATQMAGGNPDGSPILTA